MRSSFCCVGSDGSCHDGVDFAAHVLVKKACVCDKVPVGVFVYEQQERKRNINITGSYEVEQR
jgi:hypothetical protein